MSKTSDKGRKRFFLFMTFVTVLITVSAFFPFLFSPTVYIRQTGEIPNGCISAAQAYEIAIPRILKYTEENGRLILGISIEFWNSSRDLGGQRGDTSLSYPVWEVSAGFLGDLVSNEHTWHGYPYGVFGYSVLIWADTGEIRHEGAQGIM